MNNLYVKTLEPVWRNLGNVFVNEEKLQELIENIKLKKEKGELIIPGWDFLHVQPSLDCELTEWIGYICTVNAINFAFTNFQPPHNKFTIEYPEGMRWSGSFALGASFMRARAEGIINFDARRLSRISLEEVGHIFRPINYAHRIPMIKQRAEILREVGRILIKKYNGSWLNLFEEGNWRAFNNGRGVVEQLVANFPSFSDTRIHNGLHLEFHKRAQLLVMMHHGRAFNSAGRFPLIDDIEDIGPICDYKLPNVLELSDVGVLQYSAAMKTLIDNYHIFKQGDLMEIENRLATAYVLKKICDEAGVIMAQADYYIWSRGRKPGVPHILVFTTDY